MFFRDDTVREAALSEYVDRPARVVFYNAAGRSSSKQIRAAFRPQR